MEYVWEQIENSKILKENDISKQKVQTTLLAFTYNYSGLESNDYHLDRKRSAFPLLLLSHFYTC